MSNVIYIVCAVVIGGAVSMQPPINAALARGLGSPFLAATISVLISVVTGTILWLSWDKGAGEISQLRLLPWWVVIGGIIGIVFVAGSLVIAPVTGVALFFVCIVSGQLIGSMLIDQFGVFGVTVKPMDPMKIIGIVLVLIGAALVQNSQS